MVSSNGATSPLLRQRHNKRSLKRRFGNFGLSFTDPTLTSGTVEGTQDDTGLTPGGSDTTGTGITDPNLNDGNSGSDALNQLLSSQAAQFSATAFPPTATDATGALPTSDPLLQSSSDPLSVSSVTTPDPTSTTQAVAPTDPSVNTASLTTGSDAITAIPSMTLAPSASNTASASTSGSAHKSSHSAAIGVTVTFLILGLAALAFHFIRKKQMAKRESRRSTWNPPLWHNQADTMNGSTTGGDVEKTGGEGFENIDIDEKQDATILPDNIHYNSFGHPNSPPHPASAFSMPSPPPPLHPTGYAPPRLPSPPPMAVEQSNMNVPSPVGFEAPSFLGSQAPLVSSTAFAPVAPLNVPRESLRSQSSSQAVGLGLPIKIAPGTLVLVGRTFVPSLPDELPIQTGEQVRVVTKYDDGWAHVERMRSGAGVESGVVPVECLEAFSPTGAISGMGLAQIAVESWRLSKRASSLRGTGESPIQRV